MADVNPVGPIFAAGDEIITKSGYTIAYLPELHNDELQRVGKAARCIIGCLTRSVWRVRRRPGRLQVPDDPLRRHTGRGHPCRGRGQAGGQWRPTSGFRPRPPRGRTPGNARRITNRCRGTSDKYWGWRTQVAPMIRSAPIVSNTTRSLTCSPNADGTVPCRGSSPTPAGVLTSRRRRCGPGRATRRLRECARGKRPRIIRGSGAPPQFRSPRTVPLERGYRGSNLDPWYCQPPEGRVRAASARWPRTPIRVWSAASPPHCSGLLPRREQRHRRLATPDAKGVEPRVPHLYQGRVGQDSGPLLCRRARRWFVLVGRYPGRVQQHVMSGGIEAKVEVDSTLPNAAKLEEAMNKQKDLIFPKFMEVAQKNDLRPRPIHRAVGQVQWRVPRLRRWGGAQAAP